MQVDASLAYYQPSHRSATLCEAAKPHLRYCSKQHRGPSGYSTVSLSVHTLYIRLQTLLTVLPPAEVFQAIVGYCTPPATQCCQDEGAGCGCEALYKKGQSRLYFLRRLRSFNVCRTMLQMFYHLLVASVIFYAVVCWGSRVKTANANRLSKLIRKAGSVLEVEPLVEVSQRRMLRKLLSILNVSHPLHATLESHLSTYSCRLRLPRSTTEHHRRCFLSLAIKLYNSSPLSQEEN